MKFTYHHVAVAFVALIILIFAISSAFADDRIKANQSIYEFPTITAESVTASDWVPVFDASAINWKKTSAASLNDVANFEDTTATNVLAASECGKTITLNSTTEFVTTLPAPTAGCRFRFIVKSAPASASYTIVTASSANVLIGHVESADLDASADGDVSTADDTITIADGVAVVGDQVELYSDGTRWYYIGHARTYNGITASQAS